MEKNLINLKEFINGYSLYIMNQMDIKLKIEDCGSGYTIFSNGAYLGVSNGN